MRRLVGMIAVSVVLASQLFAQDPGALRSDQPATIQGSQRYVVAATKSQTRYQIDVLRVDSTVAKMPEAFRLPVIYVLDGNTLFPMVAQMVNLNTSFSSALPAVLVVSIGYTTDPALNRADNIKAQLSRRTRDLSPATTLAKAPPPGSGGAADFLAFINDDLKPFLGARHPIDLNDQTLIGHSLGGLFTIYAFLNAPDAFTRYIAASPSLFWDKHALIRQAGTLAVRPERSPRRLFVSVGGLETKERMGEDMIGDARDFVSVLQRQNVPGLSVSFQIFPDENHMSVIPTALMRGLREVQALR
jgi:predicted alpha/beta superfamily hydrolase